MKVTDGFGLLKKQNKTPFTLTINHTALRVYRKKSCKRNIEVPPRHCITVHM